MQIKKDFVRRSSGQVLLRWPDPPGAVVYAIRGTDGLTKETSKFKAVTGARKGDWILDVGARTNTLIEQLQAEGYSMAFGIDISPLISYSPYGIQCNVRDVNPDLRFQHIWLDHVLEYFGGGIFADYGSLSRFRGGFFANFLTADDVPEDPPADCQAPTMAMLAIKLDSLLSPDGRIYVVDDEDNTLRFGRELIKRGFSVTKYGRTTIFGR